jgi:hypothetical protein
MMATSVALRHKDSGILKTGFYGFSWTTLFFGIFPALFRGDFLTFICSFVVYAILGFFTFGIGAFVASFVWAFLYNGYYTRRLLERGYMLSDTVSANEMARVQLKIAAPA